MSFKLSLGLLSTKLLSLVVLELRALEAAALVVCSRHLDGHISEDAVISVLAVLVYAANADELVALAEYLG